MHPRLFTVPAFELFGRMVGPLAMPTYGILLVLGMLAGLWIVTRQARKAGLVPETITDMAVYAIIAGLMGAKVLLLIVEWPFYSRNPRELLSLFQSGGVFYGGLLGAIPVAFWYAAAISSTGGRRRTCWLRAWRWARPSGAWDASWPAAVTASPPACPGR